MFKRTLSMLLALVMVLSVCPVPAMAEEVEETVVETVAETVVETTAEETVPETTVEETVSETTAETTVPETVETIPDETTLETVPEETAPETLPEETLPTETAPEETVEAVSEEEATEEVALEAADGIVINKANFPDKAFRSYVSRYFDQNYDDVLSQEEQERVEEIDADSYYDEDDDYIQNLKGIEFFPNLTYLECSGCDLSSLDVSNNTELAYLDCSYNALKSLDISNNTALTYLACGSNELTSLDLSNNIALTDLDCGSNGLSSLDVSNNIALTNLNCRSNGLNSLDISNNTALTYLACESNELTSLDLNNNIALTDLDCDSNGLTSLDLSNNIALTDLDCESNGLSSLDVSNNIALTYLRCAENNLTDLNVSKCTALVELQCEGNMLTSLDVSECTSLVFLYCSDNSLTSLDVSGCTALLFLLCMENALTSLDISGCTNLGELGCRDNALTSLDVSNNTKLSSLYFSNNQLTILDISKNTELFYLDCANNQLTSLDFSNSPMREVECSGNQFTIYLASDRKFDLSTLPGSFDVTKTSKWKGGSVSGTILSVDEGSKAVTFAYNCGSVGSWEDYWDEEERDYITEWVEGETVYMNVTLIPVIDEVEVPEISLTSEASTGKPTISWDAVSEAASYQVYRSTSKTGSYKRIATVDAAARSATVTYQDTTAKAGTTYYYKVRTVDGNGAKSEFSKIFSRTCDLPQPVIKVTNLSSTGKIKVSWGKIEDAKEYKIYRSTDGETWKLMKTTTSRSYTNTSATAGKMYYYKVRAIASKSSANSAYSEVQSLVCKLARPSVEISGVSASGKNKLEWKKISGAEEYIIWRSLSEDEGYEEIARVNDVEFIDETAVAGTKYYYKVQAADENPEANSALSYDDSRTCDLARPVVTLRNREKDGKITVSWEAVEGAKEYKVYRATSKSGTYKLMKTTTGTEYTNTSVTAGKTYYYKVKAIHENSAANSSYSSVKSRTADLAQPQVTLAETSSGKPKLTWGKVSGVKSYKVYRSEDGGETWDLMKTTTSRSYTNTSAKAGVTYLYKVRAIHDKSAANSAYSEILGFTVN